jgi:hypothetical protein
MLQFNTTIMNEIWKDVPGYEQHYAVSSLGRVGSIRRGYLLQPVVTRKKYTRVALQKNGQRKDFFVHRLVAMAFLANPENLPEVNHVNGNRFMNRLENLEWVSRRDNELHKNQYVGSSKYPGVNAKNGKWQARIFHNGKSIYLGIYESESEAHQAYKDALIKYNIKTKYADIQEN